MQFHKAILLQSVSGAEVGTIVEVAAGGNDFNLRWLILGPANLAGNWLVPLLDADHAITVKEAAHILGHRKGQGRGLHVSTVRRYIEKGQLAPAGKLVKDDPKSSWFVSREAAQKMEFRKSGAPFGNRNWKGGKNAHERKNKE